MPHPGREVANDDGNFDGRLSGMEDVFKDHLEKLLCFLFPNGAVEPKIVAGTRILASDLSGYIESYVNLLNSDEGLSPISIFQATAKIHNNALARDAKQEYKSLVSSFENAGQTFLEEDDLRLNHVEFQKKAVEHFQQNQMEDSDFKSAGMLLDQLKKDIEDEFNNWNNRNERLKEQMVNSNESALKDASKIYSSIMDDWMKSSTVPFFSIIELNDQNKMIQEKAIDYLKTQLKGSVDFNLSFLDRLEQSMNDHFTTIIVVQNESKKKEEEDRLEKIHLKELRKQEKAKRLAAEAEAADRRAAEEVAKREAAEAEAARQAAIAQAAKQAAESQAALQAAQAAHAEAQHQSELKRLELESKHLLEMEKIKAETALKKLEAEHQRQLNIQPKKRGNFVTDYLIPAVSVLNPLKAFFK